MKKDETKDGADDGSAVVDNGAVPMSIDAVYKEMQEKHGKDKVRRFTVDEEDVAYDIILKRPTRAVVMAFNDEVIESPGGAAYQLVLDCALIPDADGMATLLEEWPGAMISMQGELLRWSGVARRKARKRVKNA